MSPKPMLTTPCSPFALGTEIHGELLETPQRLGAACLSRLYLRQGLSWLQACIGCPPRRLGIALLGAGEPSGQIRRKDSNV